MSQKDVRWFLDRLAQAWSTQDPARVAALHDAPCLLSTAQGNRVLHTREEALDFFAQTFALYARFGVATIELVQTGIQVPRVLAQPSYATAETRWRLWSTEQRPVLVHTTSQVLRRSDRGWLVTATASHDEPQQFVARSRAMETHP